MPLPDVPPGLAQQADDDAAHLRTQLVAVQAAVLAAESRYLQALDQPATLPAEGQAGPMDAAATRPAHRAQSLADLGVTYRQGTSRIQTAIHEYRSRFGVGWYFLQRVLVAARVWSRVLHEAGSETWRAYDWTESDA